MCTIFISYSRQDAGAANLLAYILHEQMNIRMDINMEGGAHITSTLQGHIRECDVFIYIVSQNSLASSWVQQEIGYALALNKPILPLSLSAGIKDLKGMVEKDILIHHLPDWQDYRGNVDKIKATIINLAKASREQMEYPSGELDLAFNDKIARTRVLVEKFQQILDNHDQTTQIVIRNMAAFSIFSLSDDPFFLEYYDYNEEYYTLLKKEKELLESLIDCGAVSLYLILYPFLYYEKSFRLKRFDSLISWLENYKDNDRIHYVLGNPRKENWYIVQGIENPFFLHGIKYIKTDGFQINTLTYNKEKIQRQSSEFNSIFSDLKRNPENESKQIVIDTINARKEEVIKTDL